MLKAFAYLARSTDAGSAEYLFYQDILNNLVDRCRTAHEVYATWKGLCAGTELVSRNEALETLRGKEEYINYYLIA